LTVIRPLAALTLLEASAIGPSSTRVVTPAVSSALQRFSGRASRTGPIATTAHSLLEIATPSSKPAQIDCPRSATITAATHSTAPSASSGCPIASA